MFNKYGLMAFVAALSLNASPHAAENTVYSPYQSLSDPMKALVGDLAQVSQLRFPQDLPTVERAAQFMAGALSIINPRIDIEQAALGTREAILSRGLNDGLVFPMLNVIDLTSGTSPLPGLPTEGSTTLSSFAVASLATLNPSIAQSLTLQFGITTDVLSIDNVSLMKLVMETRQNNFSPEQMNGPTLLALPQMALFASASGSRHGVPVEQMIYGPGSLLSSQPQKDSPGNWVTNDEMAEKFEDGPFKGAFAHCLACPRDPAVGTKVGRSDFDAVESVTSLQMDALAQRGQAGDISKSDATMFRDVLPNGGGQADQNAQADNWNELIDGAVEGTTAVVEHLAGTVGEALSFLKPETLVDHEPIRSVDGELLGWTTKGPDEVDGRVELNNEGYEHAKDVDAETFNACLGGDQDACKEVGVETKDNSNDKSGDDEDDPTPQPGDDGASDDASNRTEDVGKLEADPTGNPENGNPDQCEKCVPDICLISLSEPQCGQQIEPPGSTKEAMESEFSIDFDAQEMPAPGTTELNPILPSAEELRGAVQYLSRQRSFLPELPSNDVPKPGPSRVPEEVIQDIRSRSPTYTPEGSIN